MQPCRKIQKTIRQLDENNEQLEKEKVLTWAQNKELTRRAELSVSVCF